MTTKYRVVVYDKKEEGGQLIKDIAEYTHLKDAENFAKINEEYGYKSVITKAIKT